MSNQSPVTDAMLKAGVYKLNRPGQYDTGEEWAEAIYLAMKAKEEASPADEPLLSSIRTWVRGLPHDMESREQVLADLDAAIMNKVMR